MRYRRNFISTVLFICKISFALIHKKDPIRPCNATSPVFYDSDLLVEGEGLQLSCYVCSECEPTLRECKKKFDVAHWLRSRSLVHQKKQEKRKVQMTTAPGNLRERIRARIDANKTTSSSDIFRPKSRRERMKSSLAGQWNKFQLRLYFVVQKPHKSPRKVTDTYGRGRAPRVYVHQDQLVFRQTRSQDTGIYTCYYRGRPRVIWTITVLPPGQEPFRVVRESKPTGSGTDTKKGIEDPKHFTTSAPKEEGGKRIRRDPGTKKEPEKNTETKKDENPVTPKEETTEKPTTATNNAASESTKLDYIERPLRNKTLIRANIQVYSVWSDWSPCVPCTSDLPKPAEFNQGEDEKGGGGFQIRVGICYVRIIDPFYPIRPYRLSRGTNDELRKHDDRGLPCRSHVISEAVLNSGIKGLAKRPSEIIVRSCSEPCGNLIGTKHYKYKTGSRGLDEESASRAAAAVSRPVKRKYKTRDGERLILTCPVRGTVNSPISWFFLDTDPEKAHNFTVTAFSKETFGKVAAPAAWIALWREQLNLSDLFINSSGRVTLDPAFNIIYHEVRTADDTNRSNPGNLPRQHLACIHGDARKEMFMRADWAGDIYIEAIPRWQYYFVITGIGTVLSTLMPAFLSISTVCIVIWVLNSEIKPKMEAATAGHAYRDTH